MPDGTVEKNTSPSANNDNPDMGILTKEQQDKAILAYDPLEDSVWIIDDDFSIKGKTAEEVADQWTKDYGLIVMCLVKDVTAYGMDTSNMDTVHRFLEKNGVDWKEARKKLQAVNKDYDSTLWTVRTEADDYHYEIKNPVSIQGTPNLAASGTIGDAAPVSSVNDENDTGSKEDMSSPEAIKEVMENEDPAAHGIFDTIDEAMDALEKFSTDGTAHNSYVSVYESDDMFISSNAITEICAADYGASISVMDKDNKLLYTWNFSEGYTAGGDDKQLPVNIATTANDEGYEVSFGNGEVIPTDTKAQFTVFVDPDTKYVINDADGKIMYATASQATGAAAGRTNDYATVEFVKSGTRQDYENDVAKMEEDAAKLQEQINSQNEEVAPEEEEVPAQDVVTPEEPNEVAPKKVSAMAIAICCVAACCVAVIAIFAVKKKKY